MPIAHLPPDAAVDAVVAALGSDGAVVVDRVASPELLDAVETELRPFLDATPTGPDDFSGSLTRRTGALIARSVSCRELVLHPLVLGTAQSFLGHATNIQLHLTQAIAIGPGESAQPIHRDQWAFDFFPFPQGYEVQCNTMWALTDFTDANGATRLVPGTHTADASPDYGAPYESIAAEMPKGSVLVWHGRLWHGGGANRTDTKRVGIAMNYCGGWIRQQENQQLGIPRATAAGFSPRLRRLVGYGIYTGLIGHINKHDPVEMLGAVATDDPMVWDQVETLLAEGVEPDDLATRLSHDDGAPVDGEGVADDERRRVG